MPGTVLGPRDVALTKTVKIPCVHRAYLLFSIISLCTLSAKNEFLKVAVKTSFLKTPLKGV